MHVNLPTCCQEYHLQAVINAATAATYGAKIQQSYIPTPDATKAKDIKYDDLYPSKFSLPATYIRFSSTVEDSVGVNYCMDETDVRFLTGLNSGKIAPKDKRGPCSEDVFEEVMDFFEETSARIQPYANLGDAPLLTLDEMKQYIDENVSTQAHAWFDPIYRHHWVLRKRGVQRTEERPLMPSIKVRVLDQANDLDDADPYVCFRRREQRTTRKTRGRDAQVTEKLKKLRLELEQARALVQMVVSRESLQKQNLEISRKVFEQRRKLKEVKIAKQISAKEDNDEDLLVNQKPVVKPKARQDTGQPRPTLRLMSRSQGPTPDNDMDSLADKQAQMEEYVTNAIESRKEQHKKWNLHWIDGTWPPLTPPPDVMDQQKPAWAPLVAPETQYPSPPPSLPPDESRDREKDGEVEMQDPPVHIKEEDVTAGAAAPTPEPETIFYAPDPYPQEPKPFKIVKRDAAPVCRLRLGRGGRYHLEARKQRLHGLNRGVISDSESEDEDMPDFHPVPESKIFDYRCAVNSRARPESMAGERRQWSSGDQSAMTAPPQQQAIAGSSG